jgi:hypothetical protein
MTAPPPWPSPRDTPGLLPSPSRKARLKCDEMRSHVRTRLRQASGAGRHPPAIGSVAAVATVGNGAAMPRAARKPRSRSCECWIHRRRWRSTRGDVISAMSGGHVRRSVARDRAGGGLRHHLVRGPADIGQNGQLSRAAAGASSHRSRLGRAGIPAPLDPRLIRSGMAGDRVSPPWPASPPARRTPAAPPPCSRSPNCRAASALRPGCGRAG